MAQYKVHVRISPWPEGGFLAEVPALQGCWVVADTIGQALEDIDDVTQMSIHSRLKHGEPLPPEVVLLDAPLEHMELELSVSTG